jgi:hypothetical protein
MTLILQYSTSQQSAYHQRPETTFSSFFLYVVAGLLTCRLCLIDGIRSKSFLFLDTARTCKMVCVALISSKQYVVVVVEVV